MSQEKPPPLGGLSCEEVKNVINFGGLQKIVYNYVNRIIPDPIPLTMCIRPSGFSVDCGRIKDIRQTDYGHEPDNACLREAVQKSLDIRP